MTADQLAEKTAKGSIVTVYGHPDAGKSTFMITVAEKMKVLYIDSEGKFGKICKEVPGFEKFKKNISGIEVKTLKDLVGVVTDPMMKNYDAIIVDSVTSLVDHQSHDIMFTQKRSRSYNDYAELGTQFFEALLRLQKEGISTFLTIQAKKTEGYNEPDADGNMVQKHAMRYSDWMFFIEENKGVRSLNIKNDVNCLLKKKNIPNTFKDSLTGKDVKFASLWDVFPSKPEPKIVPKKATKKQKDLVKKLLGDLEFARGSGEVNVERFIGALGGAVKTVDEIDSDLAEKGIKSLTEKIAKFTSEKEVKKIPAKKPITKAKK